MKKLADFTVRPYHAQVEIRDSKAKYYPQWQTGDEAVVANPSCIVVATRPDQFGHVHLQVWVDDNGDDSLKNLGRSVYEGVIGLTGVG